MLQLFQILWKNCLLREWFDFVLDLKSDVQKSNRSMIIIFPLCGKYIVQNTTDGTTFMEYVQFLPSRRLYSSGKSMTSTSMVEFLPPKVIRKVEKITYREKDRPLKNDRMVGDGVMGGDPRAFQ